MTAEAMFDPDQFLQGASVSGPVSTQYEMLPVGDYKGTTKEWTRPRKFEASEGRPAAVAADLVWEINDDALKAKLGRQALTTRQQFWLELDANGKIAEGKGKNVNFGRLLEALGCNTGGNPFQVSLGRGGLIRVEHEADKKDPTRLYERVTRVTKLA